jgi:hypothetical protein
MTSLSPLEEEAISLVVFALPELIHYLVDLVKRDGLVCHSLGSWKASRLLAVTSSMYFMRCVLVTIEPTIFFCVKIKGMQPNVKVMSEATGTPIRK